MSNVIKDLSVSSSSLIGFKVEWHSSRSDKTYKIKNFHVSSKKKIIIKIQAKLIYKILKYK